MKHEPVERVTKLLIDEFMLVLCNVYLLGFSIPTSLFSKKDSGVSGLFYPSLLKRKRCIQLYPWGYAVVVFGCCFISVTKKVLYGLSDARQRKKRFTRYQGHTCQVEFDY